TGAGILTANGNIALALATAANNAVATTSAPPATITGTLNLNNGNRTITLVNHASSNTISTSVLGVTGSDDLRIDAAIQDGGTSAITEGGSGRVAVTNGKPFTGAGAVATVSTANAILTIRNAGALGSTGTVAVNAGTLELDSASSMTINLPLTLGGGSGATEL